MEVTIGSGKIALCSITRDGREGVLLRDTEMDHKVDSLGSEWVDGQKYNPTEKDIVIWLDNLAGARVLQDRINIACLKLNRYDVIIK